MLRFENLNYMWLLVLIPLLVFILIHNIRKHRKMERTLGSPDMVSKLMAGFSLKKSILKFTFLMITLFAAALGIANLQAGIKSEKVVRKGIDVIIALDVSKSMLAKDIEPNRLERAKQFIGKLLEKISNNRVGLIVFAGRAYVSVPLTVDLSALKMNLSTITPEMVPTQGTVLGEAIKMADKGFNTKETKFKSIVLITDGEDHDDEALEATKDAVKKGITIHTIGVGSTQGSPIFDPEMNANKTDNNGKEIISKLNEAELISIAQEGGGIYTQLTHPDKTADRVAQQINSSEQKNFGESQFANYDSYFQYFLVVALLFLTIEFFIPERIK